MLSSSIRDLLDIALERIERVPYEGVIADPVIAARVETVAGNLQNRAATRLLLDQPESAVGSPLKEAWLTLRQAVEARPDKESV